MKNVFDLEETTTISSDVSYIISYQSLVKFFADKKNLLSINDLVCGSHMVYGWMPTVLQLYPNSKFDLKDAVSLVNSAKAGDSLNVSQLGDLASLVNNSVVGASKLLHFVSPNNFAIWDSRIYSFIYEERPHNYRVNNPQKYLEYLELLRGMSKHVRFPDFYKSVKKKIGYEVTPFRALELVMFLRSPDFKTQ